MTRYIPESLLYIIPDVTKRLIDIDDDLLDRARAALGTTSISATVRHALEHVSRADPGTAYLEALAALPELDSVDRAAAWRTAER